jgi:dTMP kinase
VIIDDDTPEPGREPSSYPRNAPRDGVRPGFRPEWIAVEGIDGSGKSTLADNLSRELQGRGMNVATRVVHRSELTRHALERARWLNVAPLPMSLVFWLSLHEQLSDLETYPDIDVVIFDRYLDTIAVRAALEGVDLQVTRALEHATPDPTRIVLDLDPATAHQRLTSAGRPVNYWETGRLAWDESTGGSFVAYQAAYRACLLRRVERDEHALVVDATQSPATVLRTALAHVEQALIRGPAS